MLQRIDKYFNDMFLVLAIASVMDPRCKMRYIEYLSSKGERSDGNSQSTLVLDAICGLHGDYVNNDLEREHSMSDSTSDDSEEELPIITHVEGVFALMTACLTVKGPIMSGRKNSKEQGTLMEFVMKM
ncbi:hypothetical protein ACSBR2_039450 [Camellia fascicularis]